VLFCEINNFLPGHSGIGNGSGHLGKLPQN
jgi:hypothetical protein